MSDSRLSITAITRQRRDIQNVTQEIFVSFLDSPAFKIRVQRERPGKYYALQHYANPNSSSNFDEYERTGERFGPFESVSNIKEWAVR